MAWAHGVVAPAYPEAQQTASAGRVTSSAEETAVGTQIAPVSNRDTAAAVAPSASSAAHAAGTAALPMGQNWNTKQARRSSAAPTGGGSITAPAPVVAHAPVGAAPSDITNRVPAWMRAHAAEDPHEPGAAYLACKRALDVTLAAGALVALFPLLLAVGLAIWVEDRGPMLYYQTRVGRDGRQFRFYKFRSMIRNADALKDLLAAQNESTGPAFKMRNDPRITRIGRWLRRSSVDELPQLINVLRGEMSLVGPRPHLPREVEQYTERQRRRLAVQPGLLCLREVLGRSNVTFEQWVEWDLLYVQNRSLRTDLWILLRTLPAVFKADGAY